jgi:hypothetical protein
MRVVKQFTVCSLPFAVERFLRREALGDFSLG